MVEAAYQELQSQLSRVPIANRPIGVFAPATTFTTSRFAVSPRRSAYAPPLLGAKLVESARRGGLMHRSGRGSRDAVGPRKAHCAPSRHARGIRGNVRPFHPSATQLARTARAAELDRRAVDRAGLMAKIAKPDAAATIAKSLTAREKVALCGRHRSRGPWAFSRAAMQAMEIRSLAWQGDPRAFVISMNLKRRHFEARKAGKLAKGGRPLKTGSLGITISSGATEAARTAPPQIRSR